MAIPELILNKKRGDDRAVLRSKLFFLVGFIFLAVMLMTHNFLNDLRDYITYLRREKAVQNSRSCLSKAETININWLNETTLVYSNPVETYSRPTKRLLLVAHYRGGSSFLGDTFARNPSFFYWYEPLLAYFHRIIDDYVDLGLNVVADHYYINDERSLRFLPDKITYYRTLGINRTLFCRICSDGYNLHVQTNIEDRGLYLYRKEFKKECGARKQPYPEDCMAVNYEACLSSALVVTKTIRYPLYLVNKLLDDDPDLKVIYTIRDPRAIINSRRALTPEYIPMEDWINMGISYCYKFKLDQIILKQLVERYPGRMMFIRYEDLAAAPMYHVKLMYDFIGYNVPKIVEDWVATNTEMEGRAESKATQQRYGTGRNSRNVIQKWRESLPEEIVEGITTGCGEIIEKLGYD